MYLNNMLPANQATLVLNFNTSSADSQLSFGGHISDAVKGKPNKHSNIGDSVWALAVSMFTVGSSELEIPADSNVFVLDSGLPYIWLKENFYNDFKAMVLAASSDFFCNACEPCYSDQFACSSTYWENMDKLTFTIENTDYMIPPEGYTLDYGAGHACTVMVSCIASTSTVSYLGEPFMRNFVTTFDYADNTIELAVNINAPSGVSTGGAGILTLVVIIFGTLVLTLCACGGIWFYRHRNDFKDQDEFDDYDEIEAGH